MKNDKELLLLNKIKELKAELKELRVQKNEQKKENAKYKILINLEHPLYAETEEEAWDIVSQREFGAIYEVRDTKTNKICVEFMPI